MLPATALDTGVVSGVGLIGFAANLRLVAALQERLEAMERRRPGSGHVR